MSLFLYCASRLAATSYYICSLAGQHCLPFSVLAMSDQFIDEARGVQEFIVAQSKLVNTSVLQEDQCEVLVKRIGMISMSVQRATAFAELVQTGPWTPQQKEQLAKAAQLRLSPGVVQSGGGVRRKNQTLKTFECYLTDPEIAQMQDDRVSK